MIVTIKLSSFGFNIVDGKIATNEKSDHNHDDSKITQFPSLLSYFGWCFYFAGFLVGPSCEYMDYIRFVELASKYSPLKPALKRLGQSLLFLFPIIFLAPTFNYFEALKPSWKQKSFFER